MADADAAVNTSKEAAGADGGGADPAREGWLRPEQGPEERQQGGPSGSVAT